ncbi:hypothetical protein ACQP1K_29340 (plasmid) [Sphaerimonospora sp. CA-214678]|uniref:hypothetical protein n=1 Tax=Sphaerimonospora sp. CA-214678 TaxID=3240029 RepID=UPI003D92AB06
MSQNMYYRRGHWVRKPKPKSTKTSGWVVLAVIAVLAWLFTQGLGDQQESSQQSSVSETVGR